MSLAKYQQKRDFSVTPEPRGRVARGQKRALAFVIQKHAASHLHYDFRLELDGVLLSWAVPKGPSFDPADKRLAMHVEDHPLEYGAFEGTIPAKQYGGGTVMLWDRGTWIPRGDPAQDYAAGRLKFELDGDKMKGGWMLVRSHSDKYGGKRAGDVWFLIKEKDAYAHAGDPIVDTAPDSVTSGRSLDDIAAGSDRVWNSNRSAADNVRAGAVAPAKAARKRARGSDAKPAAQRAPCVRSCPRRCGRCWRRSSRRRLRATASCTRSSTTATGCSRASNADARAFSRATARNGLRRYNRSQHRWPSCR